MVSPELITAYRAARQSHYRMPAIVAYRIARHAPTPRDPLPLPDYVGDAPARGERDGFHYTIALAVDHDGFTWTTGCAYARATVRRIEDQGRDDAVSLRAIGHKHIDPRTYDGMRTDVEDGGITYREIRAKLRGAGHTRHDADTRARAMIRERMQRAHAINEALGAATPCGVRVRVYRAGIELAESSCWGMLDDDRATLADVAEDCLFSALDEARARVRELCACTPAP